MILFAIIRFHNFKKLVAFLFTFHLVTFINGVPIIGQHSSTEGTLTIINTAQDPELFPSTEYKKDKSPCQNAVDDDNQQNEILKKNPQSKSKASTWNHDNPGAWTDLAGSSCGGTHQSPINIEPNLSVKKSFPRFTFHNYGKIGNMHLINNGHTVVYNLPIEIDDDRVPFITGGGLNDTYEFAQFHLHWGDDSTKGSEHLINSQSYPGELHLVHFNTKYESFVAATSHSDGLAVLGIFLKIGVKHNKYFQSVVDQLSEVIENNAETTLTSLVSFKNLLPRETASFYRYSGSLTTPYCQQIVIWTVFDHAIEITETQMKKFRILENDQGKRLVNNFRPSQKMNDRIIYYRSHSTDKIHHQSLFIASFPFVIQLIVFTASF